MTRRTRPLQCCPLALFSANARIADADRPVGVTVTVLRPDDVDDLAHADVPLACRAQLIDLNDMVLRSTASI
jgi:hypothetical protein